MARTRNLLSLLVLALLATGCRGQVSSQPPIHPMQNMDQQVRLDPQEPSTFFADGRGMRAWPEGTVPAVGPQGEDRPCVLAEANPWLCTGKVDGNLVSELPPEIPLNRALLDRGGDRFDIYCAPCHDRAGHADGMVARRGMTPVTLHSDLVRGKPIGSVYDRITFGGPIMPSYTAQIPVEDRWAITAYVRALQISQHADLALVPGDAAKKQGWK